MNESKLKKQCEAVVKELIIEQTDSIIAKPMLAICKLAVLIPAYDEEPEVLLKLLISLAKQKNVDFNEFEVNILVNNNFSEAKNKTKAFLKNQRVIKFLNKKLPKSLNHLFINIIDKSTLKNADKINHIGRARNRGCLEIAHRFLSVTAGLNGIVAMLDADCRVSENYIESILKIYHDYSFLNGLAGDVVHELDMSTKHKQLIEKVFHLHLDYPHPKKPDFQDGLIFQRAHKWGNPLIFCGANMTFKIRSWFLAGAFPDRPSGEDYHFACAMTGILGDVALTNKYRVYMSIRPSKRTGWGSYGRRVDAIMKSVKRYTSGQTNLLLVQDLQKSLKFINQLLIFGVSHDFNFTELKKLMLQFNCNTEGLTNFDYKLMFKKLLLCRQNNGTWDFKKLNPWVLKFLFVRFPQRNVAGLIA